MKTMLVRLGWRRPLNLAFLFNFRGKLTLLFFS
jgi:hypothetical protein